mgnify:FL=1
MSETHTPERRIPASFWLGLVGAIAALLGLLALVWFKVENKELTAAQNWALLAVVIVGLLVWAWVNRAELATMLTSRGAALNTNALLSLLAVAAIAFVLNYWLIPRHLGRYKLDLTAGHYYTLSEQTKNVVGAITAADPIELVAFIPEDSYRQLGGDVRALELNRKRLEEYGRLSGNLSVKTLDPNIATEARQIREESSLPSLPQLGAIVRFKKDPTALETIQGLDESQITQGLSKLLDSKGVKRKVYFLTGHGEMPLTQVAPEPGKPLSGINLAAYKNDLEQNRYEVAEQPLIATGVPADCDVLVSIGARTAFSEAEITALRTYLKDGGRFLVALDPEGQSGLEGLLAEYGIDWQANVVQDSQFSLQPGTDLFVSLTYGTHELVRGLERYPAIFDRAGYFKRGAVPTGVDYFDLMRSSTGAKAQVRAATAVPGATEPAPAPGEASGPFDLLVAVSTQDKPETAEDEKADDKKAEEAPAADEPRTRIVAVSSPSFFGLTMPGAANTVIAVDAVNWLADNTKDLGIKPLNPWEREQERMIQMTTATRNKVLLFTFLLPLLLVIAAGLVVGVARSRR